jgi:hypothetical protein
LAAEGVVLFHTVHALLRLEKALIERGVAVRTVPTPRHLSSDCGTALCFAAAEAGAVRSAVEELGLEIEGIHELEG